MKTHLLSWPRASLLLLSVAVHQLKRDVLTPMSLLIHCKCFPPTALISWLRQIQYRFSLSQLLVMERQRLRIFGLLVADRSACTLSKRWIELLYCWSPILIVSIIHPCFTVNGCKIQWAVDCSELGTSTTIAPVQTLESRGPPKHSCVYN